MAEAFVLNAAQKVRDKLSSLAADQLSLALNAKTELKKLETTVCAIKALLADAEDQQSSNRQLRDWLRKLKSLCYDADDLLDDLHIESLRRHLRCRNPLSAAEVRRFFSLSNPIVFAYRMGSQIRAIRVRLDDIAADKAKFNLVERPIDPPSLHHRKREMTHSFERPSNVVGRNADRDCIVEMLTRSASDRGNNRVSVIPIVGIGGLGKTTLAKLAYNDERVVPHFQLRMWVCVAEDFDLKTVIEKIIMAATAGTCYGDFDLDQLQARVREILRDKKYFLVLDDVWNESYGKWIELKNLLMDGVWGSKIIVTTRSPSVASVVGTVPPYKLSLLSREDCLSLLMKWAVGGKQDQKQHSNLLEIGNEIVNKCRGVPLAVRTLGSLLHTKLDERDWLFVRDSELWRMEQTEGDILPALKLSYDQLAPYLKQCFAYCSRFPKDCLINSDLLIQLWMAQGLLHSPDQEDQEIEDVGTQYFKELCSRSFFQDVEDYGYTFTCRMHDLVHDLAVSVAQTDQCCMVSSDAQTIDKEARHLAFSSYDWSRNGAPRSLWDLRSVRSICFQFVDKGPNQIFVNACISRFKRLRVLDLADSRYERLPETICGLKHLRYLDISGNRRIKTLPNSVCRLQSLQTLLLFRCLELEELPREMRSLVSLRFLTITTKQASLPEKGIEELTSLRSLNFTRCPNLESLCKGMHNLSALRTLTITDCKGLVSLTDGIKHLTSLEKLVIYYCPKLNLLPEGEEDFGSLKSLKVIMMKELPLLVNLPRWLFLQRSSAAASTLQHLSIANCPGFTSLPLWFQTVSSLQKLEISQCPKLTSLPDGMCRLAALRLLHIKSCHQLASRCVRCTGEDWHKIAHVPEICID